MSTAKTGFQILEIASALSMLTITAFAQSEADQALQLLRLSLQCPLPPVIAKNASATTQSLTILTFNGDILKFSVSGKTTFRTYAQGSNSVDIDDETFALTANYADIRTDVSNDTLSVSCTSGSCINSISKHDLFSGLQYSSLPLHLCDQETAENAKVALDEIIRLNSLAVTAAPVSQQPKQGGPSLFGGSEMINPTIQKPKQNELKPKHSGAPDLFKEWGGTQIAHPEH
jgi:hypothetical protein